MYLKNDKVFKLLPDKCNNTKSSNSNFLKIFAMDSSAKTPLNKYNSWINLKLNLTSFSSSFCRIK